MDANNEFVLTIDRDKSYERPLEFECRSLGYSYQQVRDYESAQTYLSDKNCRAVIIERNLDGLSGLQVARILRSERTTRALIIVLIGSVANDFDVVESLDSGVDDYMVKPIGVRELVCRIKAISRLRLPVARSDKNDLIRLGALTLCNLSQSAKVDEETLKLTSTEFKILLSLAQSPGRLFSRSQVCQRVWSNDSRDGQRKIDVHVGRIRRELTRLRLDVLIRTVRGEGYFLQLPNSTDTL